MMPAAAAAAAADARGTARPLAHGLVGSGHGDDDDDAGSLVQISILHPAAAAR